MVAALVAAGFTACQTDGPPVVSLEDAEQITAKFEDQIREPPPKSVNDIIKGITANVTLYKPGCDVSRTIEEDNLRRLERNSNDGGDRHDAPDWAWAQFIKGNYRRAIKFQELAIKNAIDDNERAMHYGALAVYHGYARNYREAKQAVSHAIGNGDPNFSSGVTRQRLEYFVLLADGVFAEANKSLSQAESFYRQALELEVSFFRNRWYDAGRLALAKNLLHQGRLLEAELVAREVWDDVQRQYEFGRAILGSTVAILAKILYEQGRYVESTALAREAINYAKWACVLPHSLVFANARDVMGRSLVAQSRWKDALRVYQALAANMAEDRASFRRLYQGNLSWAWASLRLGNIEDAKNRLDIALRQERERYGEQSYKVSEVRAFLAMTQLAAGNRTGALAAFKKIVPQLLARRGDAEAGSTTMLARDRRLKAVLEDYIRLLVDFEGSADAREAGINEIADSFRLATIAGSQSVRTALSASGARAGIGDSRLANLARREQDAAKQISALYGTVGEFLTRDRKMVAALREKIIKLQSARRALITEIENEFPNYANLINPQPPSIDNARASLRPDESLIATYVGEKQTYVWAIPKIGKVTFAAADVGHDEMTKRVSGLRKALDPQATTLGAIPAFDTRAAHDLYKTLLAPVASGWRDAKRLLVVADGPLGQLPFSVLVSKAYKLEMAKAPLFSNYRKVPFLAKSHEVTVVPSVSSLITLRGLPEASPTRRAFAGFGDPWFSDQQAAVTKQSTARQVAAALTSRGLLKVRGLPLQLRSAPKLDDVSSADLAKLPRLEETADEVRNIGKVLNADPTRDVFTGRRASEGQVKSMTLSGYKVVAFATHGLVPGDLNGLIQPALALSSPKVTGGKDDGLLTMGEILGLKLDADWVVLSACNTASGNGAGSEAVSGLGRAFFYAGTRALLVSNWPVETTSAMALTTDIFGRQVKDAGLSRSKALRQSMLNLIDRGGLKDTKGRTIFSYAHPIFWAPFSLVGDGGGGKPAS